MSEDAAAVDRAQRVLEEGISTDFAQAMSYGDYLDLDTLLSAQHPRSRPAQHDELLFIVQHQVAELWMKLLLHELHSARSLMAADDLGPALKRLARVKHVQKQLVEQWDVLATLTPSEYALIRPFLATSSGFQSHQYRAVEFLLGNKNADMVRVFEHSPAERDSLLREQHVHDREQEVRVGPGTDEVVRVGFERGQAPPRVDHDELAAARAQAAQASLRVGGGHQAAVRRQRVRAQHQ